MGPTVPKLILIDGLPGSGKSTSGQQVAERISASGRPAQLLVETQSNHPLHVFPTDDMGAAWSDIHLRTTADRFAARSLELWTSFLGRTDATSFVLESYPFQSSVRVLMQMDAELDTILEYWNAWQTIVPRDEGFLIYFKEADPVALIESACRSRGEEWTNYMCRSCEQMPYAANRGWVGIDAVKGLILDYAELMDTLVAMAHLPVLTLPARPVGYDDRQLEIYRALGV